MSAHGGQIGLFGCAVALLFWLGCAGAGTDKPREAHKTVPIAATRSCTADKDCALGFCDRGSCVEVAGKSNYGGTCNSTPPAWSGEAGQPDAECGLYLCADGRCRSCRSHTECQHYFGAGQCVDATWARQFCQLPAVRLQNRDAEWTGSLACSNVGPDISVDQRLAAGKTCVRDCDCQSGLCDRGTCAGSADIGAWKYGKGRCDPQRPIAPFDLEDQTAVTSGGGSLSGYEVSTGIQCAGYLCIDHRCRSCVSDLECQEGREQYRCLPLYGLPGKRCGWPGEATFGPASNYNYPARIPKPPEWVPEHQE